MIYTLQRNGDSYEQQFSSFVETRFPSYQIFWQRFVVPLSNRPENPQLKTDEELAKINKGSHDLCIAQLHYSVLRHLIRAINLRTQLDEEGREKFGIDELVLSFSAIVGAQDVAFELLERFRKPTVYGAWLGKRQEKKGMPGGKEAQTEWKKTEIDELKGIREYRNNLIHGRTPPGFNNNYPRIGKESNYSDWRKVTAAKSLPAADFDSATNIHDSAFNETVNYFEQKWKTELLRNS